MSDSIKSKAKKVEKKKTIPIPPITLFHAVILPIRFYLSGGGTTVWWDAWSRIPIPILLRTHRFLCVMLCQSSQSWWPPPPPPPVSQNLLLSFCTVTGGLKRFAPRAAADEYKIRQQPLKVTAITNGLLLFMEAEKIGMHRSPQVLPSPLYPFPSSHPSFWEGPLHITAQIFADCKTKGSSTL